MFTRLRFGSCLRIAALFMVFGFLLAGRSRAEELNGTDFEVVYRPTALPQKSSPPWRRVGSAQEVLTEAEGLPALQITTKVEGTGYYEISDQDGGWSPDLSPSGKGVTVEFSMRVDRMEDSKGGAVGVRLSDKDAFFLLQCDSEGIWPYKRLKEKVTLPLDKKFHRFRLVVPPEGDTVSVYVDGNPEPMLRIPRHAKEEPRTHIAWGDLGANMGGQSTWQYFAFTTHGAFPPTKP